MKLISIHIDNFGCYNNYDYNFEAGLNQIIGGNGFGKSTLADFIFVMFYGMPTRKSNSTFADREHYFPFAGGRFGGSVNFECEGKNYTVFRTFGAKSEKTDELKLYEDNNDVTSILGGSNPGVYFMGVSEDTFKKSLYIANNILDTAVSGEIEIMIKNNGNTENQSKTADEIIKSIEKKIKTGVSEINRLKNDLSTAQSETRQIDNIEKANEKLKKEKEALTAEKTEISRKVESFREQAVINEQFRHYYGIKSSADSKKKMLEQLLEEEKAKPGVKNKSGKALSVAGFIILAVGVLFCVLPLKRTIGIIITAAGILMALLGIMKAVFGKETVTANDNEVRIDLIRKDLEELTKSANDFYEKNNLASKTEVKDLDENETKRRIEFIDSEINRLSNNIIVNDNSLKNLFESKFDIEDLSSKIAELYKKNEILEKTKEYITLADKRMNENFVDPVKEGFKTYIEKFGKLSGYEIEFDDDYNMIFKNAGRIYVSKHLSAGIKAVIALCMRLSVIDVIFKNNPFLILDDPFYALDSENLNIVSGIINEICKERQVIYFTCHESRQFKA